MSNQLDLLRSTVQQYEPGFTELAETHKAVNFKSEASYAIQAMKSNTFLQKIAISNPDSLKYAVLNVASIGLSLNPVQKHAYLIPRNGVVCLDISYMGLSHLAIESGAIKWMQTQVVRENDTFVFRGIGEKPKHEFNAFGDRGEITGVYCVSKTEDSEFLTEIMSIQEIHAIRDRSEAYKAYKAGKVKMTPWVTDESEMAKKTVVKRAFKMLPKNDKAERIYRAIEVDNKLNGINFDAEQKAEPITEDQIIEVRRLLKKLEKHEPSLMEHINKKFGKNYIKIGDLNIDKAKSILAELQQFAGE